MGKISNWVRGHAWPAVIIAFFVGLAMGGGAGSGTGTTDSGGNLTAANAPDESESETPVAVEEVVEEEPEPEPEPEPEFVNPSKDDFALKIKTLEQSCYGSAGCNVSIRVILKLNTLESIDPNKTYELTYKIVGADDSLLDTIKITNGDTYDVPEHFIGTPSNPSLKAVILDVDPI